MADCNLRTFVDRRGLRDGIRNDDLDYNFQTLCDAIGGGGGGDYLPLTGGTITGDVFFLGSTDLSVITPTNLDIKYGTVLHDGEILNPYTARLGVGYYFVGDSLMSPVYNTGLQPKLAFDTNGSTSIVNVTVSEAGAGLPGHFQLAARSALGGEALFQCNVTAGAIVSATLISQAGTWETSASGLEAALAGTYNSWNYRLEFAGAFSNATTFDCMPGRSVAKVGTAYQYMAPPATADVHIAVIEIGSNDTGEVDSGDGFTPAGGAITITEAQWKTAYSAIIQNFLDDGYRVVCMLAPYNDLGILDEPSTNPRWRGATANVRTWTREAAKAKGVTEFVDYNTTNLVDTLHPGDVGHELIRRSVYPQLTAVATEEAPWFPGFVSTASGFIVTDTVYPTALNGIGLAASGVVTPTLIVDKSGTATTDVTIQQVNFGQNTLHFNVPDNTQAYLFSMGGEAISMVDGFMSLPYTPTADSHAVRKDYVDDALDDTAKLTGDQVFAGNIQTPVLVATSHMGAGNLTEGRMLVAGALGIVGPSAIDESDVVTDSRTLTAGTGLTGGGSLAANRTFNVIGGTGITANANNITVDSTVLRTSGNYTMSGNFSAATVGAGNLGSGNVNSVFGGLTNAAPSDEKYKVDLMPVSMSVDGFMNLEPISYYWLDREKMGYRLQFGFTAQNVQKSAPELVVEAKVGEEEYLSFAKEDLIPVLVDQVQTLLKRVAALEAKLT